MKNYICILSDFVNSDNDKTEKVPAEDIYYAIEWYAIMHKIDEKTEQMMYEMVKNDALDFFSYDHKMVSIFEEEDDE